MLLIVSWLQLNSIWRAASTRSRSAARARRRPDKLTVASRDVRVSIRARFASKTKPKVVRGVRLDIRVQPVKVSSRVCSLRFR